MAPRTRDRGLPLREVLIGLLAIVLLAAGALVVGNGGFASAAPPPLTLPAATLPSKALPSKALPTNAQPPLDQDGPGGADRSSAASGLDADLLARFEAAQQMALDDGVALRITSGRRSAEDQQALFDEAVAEHGSRAEAERWVLPPERSAHVQGTAIDVGGWAGMEWLDENGARFGLCRVYQNEAWHFEALVEPGGTCPALRADASGGTA